MNIPPLIVWIFLIAAGLYGLWYMSRSWANTIPAGGLNNGKPKVD